MTESKQGVRLIFINGDSIDIEAISLPDLRRILNNYTGDYIAFPLFNSTENVYIKPDSVVAFHFFYEG